MGVADECAVIISMYIVYVYVCHLSFLCDSSMVGQNIIYPDVGEVCQANSNH